MMTRRSIQFRYLFRSLAVAALLATGLPGVSDAQEPVTELSGGRVFARDDLRGGLPISIAGYGPYILVADLGADSTLAVFDTAGVYVGRSGREGEGPHEVGMPTMVWADAEGFLLWDARLSRLSRIEPESPWRPEPLLTVPGGSEFQGAALVGGDAVLWGSVFRPSLFSRWTPGEATVRDYGELPPVAAESWQPVGGPPLSVAAIHPDGSKIAVAFSHSGEFVIARTSDGGTLSLSRRGDWDAKVGEVATRPGSSARLLTSPIGYMGICATESRVYALWIGQPMGDPAQLGIDPREIHVYDWDGTLQAIWRTDAPFLQPKVVGDRLYGMWPEPIPEVRVWEIGELVD